VPGHLWLRDEPIRQNAVWHAIDSTLASGNGLPSASKESSGKTSVIIRSSSSCAKHAAHAVQMIGDWFQNCTLHIEDIIDDSSDWNFEILVNGVLLHSMNTQWHGFVHDDWKQQSLIHRAISDLLPASSNMAIAGA